MASIHRELELPVPAAALWPALREMRAVHRLFPGVLTGCRLEGDTRVVTFADGMEVREVIIAIDEARRRVAYAVRREGILHHSAAMQLFEVENGTCRFAWTTDVLPEVLAPRIAALMDRGLAALANEGWKAAVA